MQQRRQLLQRLALPQELTQQTKWELQAEPVCLLHLQGRLSLFATQLPGTGYLLHILPHLTDTLLHLRMDILHLLTGTLLHLILPTVAIHHIAPMAVQQGLAEDVDLREATPKLKRRP